MTENIFIVALDQGTTSSRAIVFDQHGKPLFTAQQEFQQLYPADGWVEHQPEALWQSALQVTQQACEWVAQQGAKVATIGITNQRETTLVWHKRTGQPIYNAIVWQDRRTAQYCKTLKSHYDEADIQSRTGLLLDPYFSASKINWLLDNVPGARQLAKNNELAFGTVDSYLIWRLTGGKRWVTDITNASRTNLFNIVHKQWDDELLTLFDVPRSMLPEVLQCTDNFGVTDVSVLGYEIPILGVAGDQQAATVGQCCFAPGSIKSTYGTGCFMMVNTGDKPIISSNRLLTTVAYSIHGQTHYAVEGSIFVAGAAVQWMRDNLSIINHASETEQLAQGLGGNQGVYFVPALTGLGAPHWQPDARGAIFGLTRATGTAELARAALESVVYQTNDLIRAVQEDGIEVKSLRVDGGMVANDWLNQFLADILNLTVDRPEGLETTALGAAYLAGLQLGVNPDLQNLERRWHRDRVFTPTMAADIRNKNITGWQKAVSALLAIY